MIKSTVLFAVDSGYVAHLGAALYSLLRSNYCRKFNVVVLTSYISQRDYKKLNDIAALFGSTFEIKLLEDSLFDELKINHHFRKSNYYRLFAPDFVDEDKCLYLDADIIVTSCLDELLDIELDDYYLAAVENPGFNRHHELGMRATSKYFNSGVMLLNLKKWREFSVKKLVIDFVKNNPDSIYFVDQCGLNSVVDGNWFELDSMYNMQTSMLGKNGFSYEFVYKNSKIIHFTGTSKPWHLNNKHQFKKLYWENRNKTSYKSFFPDDFNFTNTIKLIIPEFLKKILKTKYVKGIL